MVIRVDTRTSIVSRSTVVWTRKVLQLIPDNSFCLNEGVNRLLKAMSFTANATVDSLIFFFLKGLGFSSSNQEDIMAPSMAGRLPLQRHSLGLLIPRGQTVW